MMLARRIFQKRSCWNRNGYLFHLTSFPPATIPTAIAAPAPINSLFDCSYHKLNHMYNTKGHNFSTSVLADQLENGVIDIPLAQTGEGIAECELLKWFVQEGDEVEEYQPLCEVQSDKASIEITSRYKGKVVQFLHAPGDIVKVGQPLLRVTLDGSSAPSDVHEPDPTDLKEESSELKTIRKGGALSTPAVRILAKQHGIDVEDVPGTGKHGRVQKEDVLNYAAAKGIIENKPTSFNPTSTEPTVAAEEIVHLISDKSLYQDKTLPIRGYQRAMVKSMTAASSIPHFHYTEEIKCDRIGKLKNAFQEQNSDPDVKFTVLPILIKSLSIALTTHPLLNSSFNLENYEVILKGSHNIGIAMATPVGLVVPNIKNVQSLSLLEITKELSRLQKLAFANKLRPEDIRGGTITLSNIGTIGGKSGSPLINVPEVAIIALGRIQKVPRFGVDGNVHPVSLMNGILMAPPLCERFEQATVAADHRIVDGASVALFCNEWKKLIEKPELLMMHMR